EIMEQEAAIELDGAYPVLVPYFMKEIIEQVSIAARKSKYVDHNSGVSARFSIANYRMMVASARQRAVRLGEKPAVPRISDLGHLASSSMGKLELDMMGSHQMSEPQVLDAIQAEAIKTVFEEYVDKHGLEDISDEHPRPPRRHHPHLSEVRPGQLPFSDRAAAGRGVAGVRAPALLRQHAAADGGGAGSGHPHRSASDQRPGTEPRRL